jgi:hypothetical protein
LVSDRGSSATKRVILAQVFGARRATLHGLVFSVAVALTVTPAGAPAVEQPPTSAASAVDQYVEVVPTSGGGGAVGVGETTVKPLAPKKVVELREEAGPAAEALEEVATSSAYGAPKTELPVKPKTKHTRQVVTPRKATEPPPKVPSLGSTFLGGGSSARLVVLAGLMAAATCAVAFLARRPRGDSL